MRGDIKETGLSGRECTTELHISSNIDSQKSGTKIKRILTDEDDIAGSLKVATSTCHVV